MHPVWLLSTIMLFVLITAKTCSVVGLRVMGLQLKSAPVNQGTLSVAVSVLETPWNRPCVFYSNFDPGGGRDIYQYENNIYIVII